MQNELFKQIDKKIIYAFLSSDNFLNNVDIANLSDDEIELVYESVKYTKSLYEQQKNIVNIYCSDQNERFSIRKLIHKKLIKKLSVPGKKIIHKLLYPNDKFYRSSCLKESHEIVVRNNFSKIEEKNIESKFYLDSNS